MKALEELYYVLGRLEGLKAKGNICPDELSFLKSVLEVNECFIDVEKEDNAVKQRKPMVDYNSSAHDLNTKATDNDHCGYTFSIGDPYYDSNENPWIDVFGVGEEAYIAYWNTD